MLWSYTTSSGLTVFTYLSRSLRRHRGDSVLLVRDRATHLPRIATSSRVNGWRLARDLAVAGTSVLFSMWVTFASGYQVVYQAAVVILAGFILYAFLNARRQRLGSPPSPSKRLERGSEWTHDHDRSIARADRLRMMYHVDSEVGQFREAIIHRPGLELSRLTPNNIESLLFDDVMWASKAKEEHDAFAQQLRDQGRPRPLLRTAAR